MGNQKLVLQPEGGANPAPEPAPVVETPAAPVETTPVESETVPPPGEPIPGPMVPDPAPQSDPANNPPTVLVDPAKEVVAEEVPPPAPVESPPVPAPATFADVVGSEVAPEVAPVAVVVDEAARLASNVQAAQAQLDADDKALGEADQAIAQCNEHVQALASDLQLAQGAAATAGAAKQQLLAQREYDLASLAKAQAELDAWLKAKEEAAKPTSEPEPVAPIAPVDPFAGTQPATPSADPVLASGEVLVRGTSDPNVVEIWTGGPDGPTCKTARFVR